MSSSTRRFRFGHFVFDADRLALESEGRAVALGQRGLAVLGALLAAGGRVVTKDQLMNAAWPGLVVEESNLSVQIAALRKALGTGPEGMSWIATASRVGYRFAAPLTAESDSTAVGSLRPAVAVLPFTNLGGDAADDYFVDGITEDIITALSRFRWFQVIGRNASFSFRSSDAALREVAQALGARYVLQGSVRRSGGKVRISAQLVEAASSRQVWADRYDLAMDDLFAVQDRIAEQVVGATEPALLMTESTKAAGRASRGDLDAWDRVQRGTALFHRLTRSTHLEARELFRSARALDASLPEASIWLARVSAGLVAYGWSDDPESDLAEGVAAGLVAVQLDERNPYAHYALAITSAYGADGSRATRAAEAAVEANPSFALGHLVLGMARLFAGDAAGARASLEHGLVLNPHDPQNFVWLNLLTAACLFTNDAASARLAAIRSLKMRPHWRPTYEMLACCEVAAGDLDAARRYAVQARTLPAPSGDGLEPMRTNNSAWRTTLEAWRQTAGG